jgi:predicted nucleic acid-binding protein
MISSMRVTDITQRLKNRAIKLKRSLHIKTPDAIIAASAIESDLPLITADKDFTQIAELDCIFFEV